MHAMLGLRGFSLAWQRAADGVSCGEDGVFVGDVPLLNRQRTIGNERWNVRPVSELNNDLTAIYHLPVDVTAKLSAIALVAAAFNRADLAMAAIATVQMGFPDPPQTKCEKAREEIRRCALELYRSGLLKAGWDPAEHPRTGTKPNPGWFALKPKPTSVPSIKPRSGWPLPHVNAAAREAFEEAASLFAKTGRFLFWGLPVLDGIAAFMQTYGPTELNSGEDRLTAQLKAALQAPKTLEELQQEPTEDLLGCEQHHVVGQNDANLTKDVFDKFGSDVINDPDNIIWIPRLQHECVTAQYNSSSDGPGSPLVRDAVNKMDFAQQFAIGLRILRDCGALK
jgi:hypothetical protein